MPSQRVKIPNPRTEKFEIGRVYRSATKRYYVAMDENLLVSLYQGKQLERKYLAPGWVVMQDVTHDDLCAIWGVELDVIDRMTDSYFQARKPAEVSRRQNRKAVSKYMPLVYKLSASPD